MTSDQKAPRRRYSREFKVQVMAECDEPGSSVAKVAKLHGIGVNVVHGWRKLARGAGATVVSRQTAFVPIQLAALAAPSTAERAIEVELRRGPLTMKLTWPLSAAAGFAAWTRELLR
jgi:transposase